MLDEKNMNMPMGKLILIITILAIVSNALLILYVPQYTRVATYYITASTMLFIVTLIDKYLLKNISIIEEITEKQNVAFAIFILALVLLVIAPLFAP